MGESVLDPFDSNSNIDISNQFWANEGASSNFNDLRQTDGLFAIVNGIPADEGGMVNLGAAIALGTPTFYLEMISVSVLILINTQI